MSDIAEALRAKEVQEAIGRFRGVRRFFDVGDMSAESDGNILADAIDAALSALSSSGQGAEEQAEKILGWIEDQTGWSLRDPETGELDKEGSYKELIALLNNRSESTVPALIVVHCEGKYPYGIDLAAPAPEKGEAVEPLPLLPLLRDVEEALVDLGACENPDCLLCPRALPRVREAIREHAAGTEPAGRIR